jgi:hypothetical protein
MRRRHQQNSPEGRERADVRLRRLTRSAVLLATGATAVIGVVVAKEHPGASAATSTSNEPSTTPTTTPTTSPASGGTSTPVTQAPTTTTSPPVVNSGGTGR